MDVAFPPYDQRTEGSAEPVMATVPARREAVQAEARVLLSEGKPEEVAQLWQSYAEAHPEDSDAASEVGQALAGLGRFEESLPWYRRALAVRPGFLSAKSGLALALLRLGKFDEAAPGFADVLALTPEDAFACYHLGLALRGLKRDEDAAGWFRRAHQLRPSHAESAFELGNALRDLKQAEPAMAAYRRAVELRPDLVEAATQLGSLLQEARLHGEAIGQFQAVVDRQPDQVHGWLNLAAACLGARRYPEALAGYRRALALQPSSAVAYCNMSLALLSVGRLEEALVACRTALVIEPGSAVASFNAACIHLALGNYREGWAAYDFRFAMGGKTWIREEAHALPWQGEALGGKSILVLGEQGNGDHIQFARYLTTLADLGASVTYLVGPRLHRLLRTLRGPIALLEHIPGESRFDFQCPLMSLPRWVDRLGLPIPSATPYLAAEPERVARWRERIGTHGLRIGVVWQGNIYPNGDARRSFPLGALNAIAALPGVRLISLQKGEGAEQIASLPSGMTVEVLHGDLDEGEHGFLDSAAVMEVLDLVISCDTSMAHLAGALGRPVWIALHDDPEWRWQRDREDTVWYPTARLFRQAARGDWDGVFARMQAAVVDLLGGKAPAATPPPEASSPSVAVSWGEVFDKISILEIKAERLTAPEAVRNVERELCLLKEVAAAREPLPGDARQQRIALRSVNERLWDVEDAIRACEARQSFGEDFVRLARSVYVLNDERARLKRSLNVGLGSEIVEEKQYQAYTEQ